MNLSDQVCSLKLAKRLKELNVKQESSFCYQDIKNESPSVWPRRFNLDEFAHPSEDERVAAYTATELGEMLPPNFPPWTYWTMKINTSSDSSLWQADILFANKSVQIFTSENEADLRAQMIIFFIEKGIIKNEP